MKKTIFLFISVFHLFAYAYIPTPAESKKAEKEVKELVARDYPGFFTLDESSIQTTKIDDRALQFLLNQQQGSFDCNPLDTKLLEDLNATEIVIDKIINIGKKIWEIVSAGQPVVNIHTNWASALPEGVLHWTQLDSWQAPKAVNYSVSVKNKFGMDVVEFVYRVLYTYGGGTEGVGHYLTNVKVVPLKISTLWGFKLNVNVEVPSVFNTGSSRDPIGALELVVSAKVETVIKKVEIANTFYIDGKGAFNDFK